jgi:hypothetical protein
VGHRWFCYPVVDPWFVYKERQILLVSFYQSDNAIHRNEERSIKELCPTIV